MNKSKMDNMFREKLYGHKVAARPEAWTKLKGGLDSGRKRVMLIYWRVAAIIILLLSSVVLIYKMNNANLQAPVADTQREEIQPQGANKYKSGKAGQAQHKESIIESKQEQHKETIVENGQEQTGARSLAQTETDRPAQQIVEQKQDNTEKSLALAVNSPSLKKMTGDKPVKTEKPIHIEAVAPIGPKALPAQGIGHPAVTANLDERLKASDPIEEKGLPNVTITFKKDEGELLNESPDDDEGMDKVRKFALKKVIVLAKGIKEGEVGISTLREKKDELLAFNFKKKKNVKNSK